MSENVQVFTQLRELRALQREYFPQLRTVLDHDIVVEIGYHQEHALPLAWSHLILQGLGSPATVNRRMARLHRLGIIDKSTSSTDGRVVLLTLNPETRDAYHRYVTAIALGEARRQTPQRSEAKPFGAPAQPAVDHGREDGAGAGYADRSQRAQRALR